MMHRSIGATSLARLLGIWRGVGQGDYGAAYHQLATALRQIILDGRLPLDIRLPGERELALALGVSRTTISAAFANLRDEGYLQSRQGSGSRTSLPGDAPKRPDDRAENPDKSVIDMSVAALPASEGVHRAYRSALAQLPRYLPEHGYEARGLECLRTAIADKYSARDCPTDPEQIMVTYGAQHGLALLLRLLTGPGDRVVVDHPTYPLAIDAIHHASCRAVPVGLPEQGWDIDTMRAAFRQTSPRMAYLVADFHNPTGRCMDAPTRAAIVDIAAQTRTVLVVDETMVNLWLDTPPPAPVASFDQSAWVISVGSTGKSFWGGLRIGWIRADKKIISGLARIRGSLDLGTPIVEQLAVTSLLQEGQGDLDIRRNMLRGRRDFLMDQLGRYMPDWQVKPPPGGLSLWVELPVPISSILVSRADAEGVRINPGPRFGVDGSFERYIRLPFSQDEPVLADAVQRLARAARGIGGGQRHQVPEKVTAVI